MTKMTTTKKRAALVRARTALRKIQETSRPGKRREPIRLPPAYGADWAPT